MRLGILILLLLAAPAYATDWCYAERRAWEMDKNSPTLTANLQECNAKAEVLNAQGAKEQAALEAKRAAVAARPSPRIGMTRKQVVNGTNWGEPDTVNTTETASGTKEQWVYGRDYLYFTNGRLTAIQTSR